MLPDADDMILGCAHRSSMADPAYVHAEKHLLDNIFADIQASPSDNDLEEMFKASSSFKG